MCDGIHSISPGAFCACGPDYFRATCSDEMEPLRGGDWRSERMLRSWLLSDVPAEAGQAQEPDYLATSQPLIDPHRL